VTQPPPLFTPSEAAVLLDQVLYERVLESVDLDALYELEHSLASMIGDLHGLPYPQATEATRAVVDRCLARLPEDIRRYLRAGPFVPFGPGDPASRCEDRPGAQPSRRAPAGPRATS